MRAVEEKESVENLDKVKESIQRLKLSEEHAALVLFLALRLVPWEANEAKQKRLAKKSKKFFWQEWLLWRRRTNGGVAIIVDDPEEREKVIEDAQRAYAQRS